MNLKRDLREFCGRAVALGATRAKVIPVRSVAVREWVRLKCQFGCGGYGGCLTCPPRSPTPETTRRVLAEYRWGILIEFDTRQQRRDWKRLHRLVADLEREVFLRGYHAAYAFASGPCPFCSSCNLDGACRHPELARPAMEACGIDVFTTARNNGFKIEVVRSEQDQPTFFNLLLVE